MIGLCSVDPKAVGVVTAGSGAGVVDLSMCVGLTVSSDTRFVWYHIYVFKIKCLDIYVYYILNSLVNIL